MNDNHSESSFMKAASQNIRDLQTAVVELQAAAASAKEDASEAKTAAASAQKEATRWHKLTRVLVVVVLVTMVGSGLAIYNWVKQADSTSQLRNQAIASCEAGNAQRGAEVNVWNHILDATLAGSKQAPPAQQKATVLFVNDTRRYLEKQLAPRDCAQAYTARAQGR